MQLVIYTYIYIYVFFFYTQNKTNEIKYNIWSTKS